MKKVLVIAGLTASGKTDLSLKWAKELQAEIINGDSQQVYRELNIGTAKISESDRALVTHHLIDILDYSENFHVKAFQRLCRDKIEEITLRNHLPILVGGTGLYLKAALYDYVFEEEDKQNDFEDEETEVLYQRLLTLDPMACEKIHANNRKRIVRALNMAHNGELKSDRLLKQEHKEIYDVFWLVLAPEKSIIDERIEKRVDEMIENGLKEEVEKYFSLKQQRSYQSFQAIGYKEWAPYFEDDIDIDTIKQKIMIHTRQFAKRQKTWFKNQLPSVFVNSLDEKEVQASFEKVKAWLKDTK